MTAARHVFELPALSSADALPGIAVRAARTMVGLSQGELAKLAGSAQVTVAKVENALVRPGI